MWEHSVCPMVCRVGITVAVASLYSVHAAAHPDRGTRSFCDGGVDGFNPVFADEFDEATLDLSSWNVAVTPTNEDWGETAHRKLELDKDSTRDTSNDAGPARRSRAPRADCSGIECILLGSCRDAACVDDDVYLENGSLVLRSRNGASKPALTTGAVNTWGKKGWRTSEGTFRVCISAQLPGYPDDALGSQGVWPAHWLMPHDSTCDPDEGEMDVMEMVDGNGLYEATYHWQTTFPKTNCSYPKGHEHAYTSARLPSDWNTTYHEYAVERSGTHIAFVLDGVVHLNVSKDSVPNPPIFWDVEWYLILNTAIGGGWPGPANSSTKFPVYHRIDYVRVSQQPHP